MIEATLETIDYLTADLLPYFKSIFYQLAAANPANASILCDFLTAEQNESNIKPSTRSAHISIVVGINR
jgi:hypothetical protein